MKMAKKIVGIDGEVISSVGSVKKVSPCGSQILVEILTPQELMNTNLRLSENTDLKLPLQGYIKAVGPAHKSDWGFDVGNRVLISGSGVMVPNTDGSHRDTFLMEPSAIKAVLAE